MESTLGVQVIVKNNGASHRTKAEKVCGFARETTQGWDPKSAHSERKRAEKDSTYVFTSTMCWQTLAIVARASETFSLGTPCSESYKGA